MGPSGRNRPRFAVSPASATHIGTPAAIASSG